MVCSAMQRASCSTAGSNLLLQRATRCSSLLTSGPRPSSICHAYQQSQADNALQQPDQQPDRIQQTATQLQGQDRHHIDPEAWDMNYWHYQPWWLQPHTVVGTGVAFITASLVINHDETTLKTATLAAGPVALYWFIFLFLLPRTFKNFAVEYIETHPEVEELAHMEEQQQQQQQKQQN